MKRLVASVLLFYVFTGNTAAETKKIKDGNFVITYDDSDFFKMLKSQKVRNPDALNEFRIILSKFAGNELLEYFDSHQETLVFSE